MQNAEGRIGWTTTVVGRGSWAGNRHQSASGPLARIPIAPELQPESGVHRRNTLIISFSILLLISAGLRIPGLFTDFWGDEIWSWSIAGQLHSISDVLLAVPARIDNNHPLNTLLLYLMGQNQPVWLYRLPALLAGAGSVLLAAGIMLRFGNVEAFIAGLLFTANYPLIFYSSEARGYSFAVFFSLLSFALLRRSLSVRSSSVHAAQLCFGLSCVLGLLSHLTFLHIYLGTLVWSMLRVRRLEPTTRLRAIRLARLHAIPMLACLALFRFFIRDMVVGGAAPTSSKAVLLQTLSFTAGGPAAGIGAVVSAIIVGLLFVSGLIYLGRSKAATGTAVWTFFLVAVVISPALACVRDLWVSERPQPLMLRYFLVCLAMLLLSLCPLLATVWRRGALWKLLLCCALMAYVAGNATHVESFLTFGRGQYAQALSQIARESSGKEIAIATDNPNRTRMLINFYGKRTAPDRRLSVSDKPRQWLIFNRTDRTARISIDFDGHPYRLEYNYLYGDLSGWAWEVYRQE